MKVCLATLGTPEVSGQLALTLPGHARLAAQEGWSLHVCRSLLDTSRPPAWSKLLLVARLLPLHDAVVWLDADLLVRSPAVAGNLVKRMLCEAPVCLVRQPRDESFNSGLVAFRSEPQVLRMLGRVYFEWPMAWDCPWWEQEAFNRLAACEPNVQALPWQGVVDYEGPPEQRDLNAPFYHPYGPVDKIACLTQQLR